MASLDYFFLPFILYLVIEIIHKFLMHLKFKKSGAVVLKIKGQNNKLQLTLYFIVLILLIFLPILDNLHRRYLSLSYILFSMWLLLLILLQLYCELEKSKFTEGGFTYRGDFIEWSQVRDLQWWKTKDDSFILVIKVHKRNSFHVRSSIRLNIQPNNRDEVNDIFKNRTKAKKLP